MIVGSEDVLTPVADARPIAELVPGATLEIVAGAAHGFMIEQANAFNKRVLAFLANQGKARMAN